MTLNFAVFKSLYDRTMENHASDTIKPANGMMISHVPVIWVATIPKRVSRDELTVSR